MIPVSEILNDAINSIEYKDHFVITPNSKFINWDKKKYLKYFKSGKNCRDKFTYNSQINKDFLTINQIKKLVEKFSKENDIQDD